jgi:hypothetical protein
MIGYLAYQKYKGSGCRLNNNELFSNAFARFEHSV